MRSKHPGDHSSTREVTPTAASQARLQRRHFLLTLGAGGAGAAIVAARALSGGAVAPDAAVAPEGKGYAVTDHVRRYYRTAKI
jgi:precorrin-6B methylase 2